MSEVEATAASGSLFGQVPLPIGSEAKRKADQQDVRWQRTRFVAALLLTDALLGGLAFAGAIAICTQALPPAMVLAGSLGAQIPLMLAALVALYALLGLYSMRTETLLARFRCRATAALIFGLVGMLLWARGGSASEAGSFAFGGALSLVLGSWADELRKPAFVRWTTERAANDRHLRPGEASPALAGSKPPAGPLALEPGQFPTPGADLAKRAFDLVLAVPLTLVAAPVVGAGWLLVKISDRGPAFYWQWRLGRYGRPIKVFKLRTMYQDADQRLERVLANNAAMREQWQRYFKLPDDPRILPYIGKFLRKSSIDELPQLWNILRGDMSLVGPRPFPEYHMEAFDAEFRELRLTVPPGLTGLWQISSRSDGDVDMQRAEDCLYIRNRCFWLDVYILVATIPALIASRGAH
jgi:lipopolysaccharide/colanic/teichoic acid biosynthesis glycosyltransferase